jgi:hypothetical protein
MAKLTLEYAVKGVCYDGREGDGRKNLAKPNSRIFLGHIYGPQQKTTRNMNRKSFV